MARHKATCRTRSWTNDGRCTCGLVKTQPPTGWHDGVLHCYGGCGTRYADFLKDVSLPTSLWNRIAVGPPFDETETGIEREGRGGVLCPACIIERLAALPDCTVICADIERPPGQLVTDYLARIKQLRRFWTGVEIVESRRGPELIQMESVLLSDIERLAEEPA